MTLGRVIGNVVSTVKLAVYEGFKLSIRKISAEELQEAITGTPAGM